MVIEVEDDMADRPLKELNSKTSLEVARLKNRGRLTSMGLAQAISRWTYEVM